MTGEKRSRGLGHANCRLKKRSQKQRRDPITHAGEKSRSEEKKGKNMTGREESELPLYLQGRKR